MQKLFSFTFNTETQEVARAGNISSKEALQILQQIVIAEAIKEAVEKKESNAE